MKIGYLDPSPGGAPSGNVSTSQRLLRHWRQSGHKVVSLSTRGIDKESTFSVPQMRQMISEQNIIIALHSLHSMRALRVWQSMAQRPPLIFVVSGTDLFQPLLKNGSISKDFQFVCSNADAIVTLADGFSRFYPKADRRQWAKKTQFIAQGAKPLPSSLKPPSSRIRAVVVANFRMIKDPLLPVRALEKLLAERIKTEAVSPQLEVLHFGSVSGQKYKRAVENSEHRISACGLSWRWKGVVTQGGLRRWLGSSHLLIQPSLHEGGANIVGEAVMGRIPIIASRIPGNTGLLGVKHPGLFSVGSATGLARRLQEFISDEEYRQELKAASERLSSNHDLEKERIAWADLIENIGNCGSPFTIS